MSCRCITGQNHSTKQLIIPSDMWQSSNNWERRQQIKTALKGIRERIKLKKWLLPCSSETFLLIYKKATIKIYEDIVLLFAFMDIKRDFSHCEKKKQIGGLQRRKLRSIFGPNRKLKKTAQCGAPHCVLHQTMWSNQRNMMQLAGHVARIGTVRPCRKDWCRCSDKMRDKETVLGYVGVWIGLIWLRTGTNGGIF
jgi:hypothetical protein